MQRSPVVGREQRAWALESDRSGLTAGFPSCMNLDKLFHLYENIFSCMKWGYNKITAASPYLALRARYCSKHFARIS